MNIALHPSSSVKLSLLDLEDPIISSKATARAVMMMVDAILESKHPTQAAPEGCTILLLDNDDIEALNHCITDLLSHTRKASETFKAVYESRTISSCGGASQPAARQASGNS
jgi:hypothetical protein